MNRQGGHIGVHVAILAAWVLLAAWGSGWRLGLGLTLVVPYAVMVGVLAAVQSDDREDPMGYRDTTTNPGEVRRRGMRMVQQGLLAAFAPRPDGRTYTAVTTAGETFTGSALEVQAYLTGLAAGAYTARAEQ